MLFICVFCTDIHLLALIAVIVRVVPSNKWDISIYALALEWTPNEILIEFHFKGNFYVITFTLGWMALEMVFVDLSENLIKSVHPDNSIKMYTLVGFTLLWLYTFREIAYCLSNDLNYSNGRKKKNEQVLHLQWKLVVCFL